MKRKVPYDPEARLRAEAEALNRQTEHWRVTFEKQVQLGLDQVAQCGGLDSLPPNRTFGLFEQRTPRQWLVKEIRWTANTIRAWWAWGEPTISGKAICEKLKVEKRIMAQILIRARSLLCKPS